MTSLLNFLRFTRSEPVLLRLPQEIQDQIYLNVLGNNNIHLEFQGESSYGLQHYTDIPGSTSFILAGITRSDPLHRRTCEISSREPYLKFYPRQNDTKLLVRRDNGLTSALCSSLCREAGRFFLPGYEKIPMCTPAERHQQEAIIEQRESREQAKRYFPMLLVYKHIYASASRLYFTHNRFCISDRHCANPHLVLPRLYSRLSVTQWSLLRELNFQIRVYSPIDNPNDPSQILARGYWEELIVGDRDEALIRVPGLKVLSLELRQDFMDQKEFNLEGEPLGSGEWYYKPIVQSFGALK